LRSVTKNEFGVIYAISDRCVPVPKKTLEAAVSGTVERLRPVVMTTLAAIAGMLPLTLGRGIGSEVRVAMGAAMIGGLALAAFLTLVVVPLLGYLGALRRQRGERLGSDQP